MDGSVAQYVRVRIMKEFRDGRAVYQCRERQRASPSRPHGTSRGSLPMRRKAERSVAGAGCLRRHVRLRGTPARPSTRNDCGSLPSASDALVTAAARSAPRAMRYAAAIDGARCSARRSGRTRARPRRRGQRRCAPCRQHERAGSGCPPASCRAGRPCGARRPRARRRCPSGTATRRPSHPRSSAAGIPAALPNQAPSSSTNRA